MYALKKRKNVCLSGFRRTPGRGAEGVLDRSGLGVTAREVPTGRPLTAVCALMAVTMFQNFGYFYSLLLQVKN